MENVFLVLGSDRRKNPEKKEFRFMSFDEIKRLQQGSRQFFVSNDGKAREATITLVKTWKTRPDSVEIHAKYGLYEYASWNTMEAIHRLIVPV